MKSTFGLVFLRKTCCLLAAATAMHAWGAATNEPITPAELKRLSIEELMAQEVSIVTRREQRLSQSPSAAQVISGEDIRRSGALSIPEALRLAPNLQVAQVDSRQWAISARGFNQPGLLANKLQVMMDGRTLYTPLFSGIFWDVQDTLLEDVERIEVVSGPGATLWGANAVNGTVNIVTKSAKDTQGGLLMGGGGTQWRGFTGVRFGGQFTSNVFFRVYGKYLNHNDTVFPGGRDATNAWDMGRGGFRIDWDAAEGSTVTLQGDAYTGTIGQPTPGDTTVDGQNLLARWTRTYSEDSILRLQIYFDRTWRHIPGQFAEDLKTYDIDVQHRFRVGERQALTWGFGYRLMEDDVNNSDALAFLPEDRNLQLFSGFLQDEIALIRDRLNLTIGTRLEHNDFSGFEVQPSARLAWTPDDRQTIWAAVSRAVRSPSRIDTDFYVPGMMPFFIAGGTNFTSETLMAYEIGYRVRPLDPLVLSLAAFYNDYDDIRSAETRGTSLVVRNGLEAQSWGVELSGELRPVNWWRVRGGYTYLHKDVWEKPGRVDFNDTRGEGNDAKHQFVLQSMLDLPANAQFDLTARYVDSLPSPRVPGYFTLDARLAWRPLPDLELSVVGQNLWHNRHPEFGAPAQRQEIPRSVYGKLTFWF